MPTRPATARRSGGARGAVTRSRPTSSTATPRRSVSPASVGQPSSPTRFGARRSCSWSGPTATSTAGCSWPSAPSALTSMATLRGVAGMRRERHPDHEHAIDAFLMLVGALLLAGSGLVWLVGQVAAILFGAHQHLPVRLDDMFGVLLQLPGPVGMYAALALTVWAPVLLVGWLLGRWRLPAHHARTPRRQRGARWASLWQLRRLLVTRPRPGRIVLGRRDRLTDRLLGKVLLAVEPCHSVLAFGPPGSYKTHALVIPAILEWQGPLIATSIKPDVLRATLAHRARLGAVWVYDPLGLSGAPAAQWTPLA